MSNLIDQLGHLHDGPDRPASDGTVGADLERGRRALRTRRRRRGAALGVGALALAAAGSLSYVATSGSDQAHAPVAEHSTSAPASTTHHAASSTPSKTVAPSIRLVSYDGRQLPGYEVKQIPEGYVLQGISGSVLDVAEQGDHSSLNTFVNKMVVSVDADEPTSGTPVQVKGVTGHLAHGSDGTRSLTYDDHGYPVGIQVWSNIKITDSQLIQFADGVTVTKQVQESHG